MAKQTKQEILQVVSVPLTKEKKNKKNGLTNGNGHTNGEIQPGAVIRGERTFEQRFEQRYEKMPPLPEDIEPLTFSDSSQKILKERYLLKSDSLEAQESIPERFWHVAYEIASGDFDFGSTETEVLAIAKDFYAAMVRQEFLPNSPTIMNAGKGNRLQYSACFVLPVEDSLVGIFDAIKYAALIHQTGGGTGFAFSRLRPQGSIVGTTGGVASGPISFLKVFNAATHSIKQGSTRRGANMGILRIDHPDILEFIRCKAELDDENRPLYDEIASYLPDDSVRKYFEQLLLDQQISNFNISVAVTDRFMDAYFKGEDYELIDPKTKEVTSTLNAREVFQEITERAWQTGDPGLVFIDRINKSTSNPMQGIEEIEATNPCGEQPLAAWDACNLGSINLGKFVLADGSGVDWEGLREITHKAVHFLDNVVQVNPYTLPQIYDEVHNNRRIGLGVMGWADMLFKLKIPYNSEAATELAEHVMKLINEEGHLESEALAEVRGPFPNWSKSIYRNGKPLRNSTVTTIAPTGTISIIGDCSSGIEPVFALAYLHKAKTGADQVRTLVIANQTFEKIAKREGFYSDDLAQKVMGNGSVAGLEEVPSEWQDVFITAQSIDPEWHVRMQAAFQKYTDNGVSKTINMPNSATVDDVANAYMLAWETGCNGITVYRDGSKAVQVLNLGSSRKTETKSQDVVNPHSQDTFVQRPLVLRGRTYRAQTPLGEAFVTINRDEQNQPFEVFVTIGKGGMHTMADAEAIGRLVSLSLRLARGNDITPREVAEKIVSQLKGIGGASHIGFGKDRVMSLADAIAKVLSEDLAISAPSEVEEQMPLSLTPAETPKALTNGHDTNGQLQLTLSAPAVKSQADLCPECGAASFIFEEGCQKCYSCGYSKC